MKYPDLIFDLYGTLVDIHTDENEAVWDKTAHYFSFHGASYTGKTLNSDYESVVAVRESDLGQSYEMHPDIPFDGVMAELFRRKGITEQADTLGFNAAQLFRICSTEYIRLYDDVIEALTELRKQGYRLWLLSNAQRAFTAYELRMLNLTGQFDGIYLSSDYLCRKPDSRFFRALMDEQKLKPDNCLMIGNDRDTDIAGARRVGLATLYMHTNLTPAEQAPATTPSEHQLPGIPAQYEFEGSDWRKLLQFLIELNM